MKRKLIFGLLLLISFWGSAQTVDIDDPAFEDALIALGYDSNPVRNGSILTSDAEAIINLDISNQGITNLSGLEFFSALETLDVSGNDLNELVLQNLSLVTIKADDCNLAGKQILFQNNPPSGLFLTNVTELSLANNGFGNAGSTVSFGGVPNVVNLDVQGNNFGTIQLNETLKIETLTADNCPNLSTLINLNLLTELRGLILSNCTLNGINVSSNKLLQALVLFNNNISIVDLSQNSELAIFRGSNNAFSSLDFSQNPSMTSIEVSSNSVLNQLNIANGNNAILSNFLAQSTALDCIQVDEVTQAENAVGWQKDANTTYSTNCSAQTNIVEVAVTSGQPTDMAGNYVITAGTNEITIGFDLEDENGSELPASALSNYNLVVNTLEHPTSNSASGGVVPTQSVDFELLTNQQVTITPVSNGEDGNQEIKIGGDGLFEGDEFFFIEVTTNDPNITLKNAENGVVQIPVKIIDNEETDITLTLERNGAEPSQNATLRITSSLQNDTGAPMPFNITLGGGPSTAVLGEDYLDLTNQPSIANGESFVEFDVTILNNDTEAETEEEFFANINYAGNLPNSRVDVQNFATEVPIVDDGNVDSGLFTASATVTGAGEAPNYTVTEGQIFTIQFNALTNQEEGQTFSVPFTVGGNAIPDDDFRGSQSPGEFTVNNNSTIDGSLTFTTRIDTFDDGGDVIQINLPKPTSGYQWENANLDGSLSFSIILVERTDPVRIGVSIFESNSEIPGSSYTEDSEPVYSIIEGDRRVFFKFEALNLNSLQFSGYFINIVTPVGFGSATPNIDYVPIGNFAVVNVTDNDFDQLDTGIDYVDIFDDTSREFTESFAIEMFSDNPLISFVELKNGVEGEVLSPGEKYRFWIDIKDNENNSEPFILKPTLSSNVSQNNGNLSISEGENLEISFKALSPAPLDFIYKVSYANSGSATLDNDFERGGEIASSGILTVGTSGLDGSAIFELFDNDGEDSGENLVLRFPPDPEGIYIWDNADPVDGSVTFSIDIIDALVFEETVEFKAELKGITFDENGNYSIDEGEDLELWIEAVEPNNPQNQTFSFDYAIETSGDLNDFRLESVNPYSFNINNGVDPDGKLVIKINADNFNDPNESITLKISGSDYIIWQDGTTDNEGRSEISFNVKINDIAPPAGTIIAEIDNIGGMEGEKDDVFTLTLKNADGTLYLASQEIIFGAIFSPTTAEISDFIPKSNEFRVLPNTSTATINVSLPDEDIQEGQQQDSEHELYTVTVNAPTNFNQQIRLPRPLEAKIIDDEGKFIVYSTIKTLNNINSNYVGDAVFEDDNTCCPYFKVEEGDLFEVAFEAEKGVPEDTEYGIKVGYDSGDAQPPLPEGQFTTQAIEKEDFRNRDSTADVTDEFFYDVDENEDPDNILQISILSANEEPFKEKEGVEMFEISYSVVDSNKYTFQNDNNLYTANIVIFETNLASIFADDAIIDEENTENDKGKFLIQLEDEAASKLTLTYTISGNASNGEDYIRIMNSVTFEPGDMEREIIIEALPDDIPEDEEKITITLIDGKGYSLNDNNKSASVSISENDEDKIEYKITVEAVEDKIFEDPNQQNTGTFIIKLDKPKTNNSDLEVNYAFIDGGAINVAEENSDFTQNGNGKLVFTEGEQEKLVIISALEDPEAGTEDSETVTLQLQDGLRYKAINPKEDSIEISSTEFDNTTLSQTALEVVIISNTCANSREGDIVVKNSSQFDFEVTVQPGNMTEDLSGSSETPFKDLEAGTYLISFTFVDQDIDIIPPSFEVTIQNLEGTSLLAQEVNLSGKTANLLVSGSRQYTVLNDGIEYDFEFGEYSEKSLTIPISDGLNNIKIMGEAACQGTIETTLYLNDFKVFPNPTAGTINFYGFLLNEDAVVEFTDLSGKSILSKKVSIRDGSLQLDISNSSPGVYFGQIKTESGQQLGFKILKK